MSYEYKLTISVFIFSLLIGLLTAGNHKIQKITQPLAAISGFAWLLVVIWER